MDLRWFSKHDALPHDKWDFNTATFGGNLPGASWEWPEATYARREQIAKMHENYHRGLLYFLANDERVPEKVRAEMRRFGLTGDEFTDHGGWPHQLYIREARRMVSDLVLTEQHTFGRQVAPASIGLGSYGTDTHEIRRIVKDGVVIREGKTAGGRDGFGAYQIGYGAIIHGQRNARTSSSPSHSPPATPPSAASAWSRSSWSPANPPRPPPAWRSIQLPPCKMSITRNSANVWCRMARCLPREALHSCLVASRGAKRQRRGVPGD